MSDGVHPRIPPGPLTGFNFARVLVPIGFRLEQHDALPQRKKLAYVASGGSVEGIDAIFTLTLIPRKLLVGPE